MIDGNGLTSNGNMISSRIIRDNPLVRIDSEDDIVKEVNQIYRSDKPNNLEEKIINCIDLNALIDQDTPIYTRFLLTMISIEGLLIGGHDDDSISGKLSERVAYLLGESEPWLVEFFQVDPRQIPPEAVSENRVKLRTELLRFFKELYGKRSGAAHEGPNSKGRIVEESDYREADWIVRFLIFKLLDLRRTKGLTSIEKAEKPDGKSLAEYIQNCKFSFDITPFSHPTNPNEQSAAVS